MTLHEKAHLDSMQAADAADLLDHVAWTDVILPKIEKARQFYVNQLVSMTLGATINLPLTKEQVAGRIHGIDFITQLMKSILARGAKADEFLREHQLTL